MPVTIHYIYLTAAEHVSGAWAAKKRFRAQTYFFNRLSPLRYRPATSRSRSIVSCTGRSPLRSSPPDILLAPLRSCSAYMLWTAEAVQFFEIFVFHQESSYSVNVKAICLTSTQSCLARLVHDRISTDTLYYLARQSMHFLVLPLYFILFVYLLTRSQNCIFQSSS